MPQGGEKYSEGVYEKNMRRALATERLDCLINLLPSSLDQRWANNLIRKTRSEKKSENTREIYVMLGQPPLAVIKNKEDEKKR